MRIRSYPHLFYLHITFHPFVYMKRPTVHLERFDFLSIDLLIKKLLLYG